jgi:hypothetical protein
MVEGLVPRPASKANRVVNRHIIDPSRIELLAGFWSSLFVPSCVRQYGTLPQFAEGYHHARR